MNKITTVLATGKTHTTGTDGAIFAGKHDGRLNLQLTTPGQPALPAYDFAGVVAHPTAEQMFAGAWSACYSAAVGIMAKEMKVALPTGTAVDIEVDLGMRGAEYLLQARITLVAPGVPHDVARELAHAADKICPYSKATRGNIDVTLNVLTA